jgi:DHA1 family multidrug resistance protein-like MFS transporter
LKSSFALPIIYLIGFCEFASQSVLLPAMPLYTANLGASVSEIGAIIALLAFGTALFMIPCGLLSDRFGRRTLLVTGLLISTLAAFLYTLTTNTLELSLLRGLHGIGLAAQIPVTIAAALDLSPEGQRGKTLGWYTTSTQAGLMVGPLIGGYLLSNFNFTTVFITSGFISLAGLVTVLLLFRGIPQAEKDEIALITSWEWLKRKALYGAVLTPFAISIGIGTIAAYIPIYCKGFNISAIGAGLIITLLYTSSTMLRIVSGTMSDRIGRKPMILFGLALSAISAALMANFHTLALLGIVAFCFGIGMSIVQPSGMALTADLAPHKTRGLAIGMFTTLYQFGSAVGPSAMGAVAESSNLETMFLACGLTMAFVLLIIYILFRPAKNSVNIA